jgi:hypothetical protein
MAQEVPSRGSQEMASLEDTSRVDEPNPARDTTLKAIGTPLSSAIGVQAMRFSKEIAQGVKRAKESLRQLMLEAR